MILEVIGDFLGYTVLYFIGAVLRWIGGGFRRNFKEVLKEEKQNGRVANWFFVILILIGIGTIVAIGYNNRGV